MEGDIKTNCNEELDDEILFEILSRLSQGSLDSIYGSLCELFKNKKIRKENVEQCIHDLIYENGYAKDFLERNESQKKKVFFSSPFTNEEILLICLLSEACGEKSLNVEIIKHRDSFEILHTEKQIKEFIDRIPKLLTSYLEKRIYIVAENISKDESTCINKNFSEEELQNSNISQELYNWWKMSFQNNLTEDSNKHHEKKHVLYDECIEKSERTLESIIQAKPPYLGVLSTLEDDYFMRGKIFLVHEKEYEEVNLDLKTVDGFELSSEGSCGFVLMLKNDCMFYLENIGETLIIVDAITVKKGDTIFINDNTCIEIGNIAFVFKINWKTIHDLKKLMSLR